MNLKSTLHHISTSTAASSSRLQSPESPACDQLRPWRTAGAGEERNDPQVDNHQRVNADGATPAVSAVPEEDEGLSLSGLWPRRGQCHCLAVQAPENTHRQMLKDKVQLRGWGWRGCSAFYNMSCVTSVSSVTSVASEDSKHVLNQSFIIKFSFFIFILYFIHL